MKLPISLRADRSPPDARIAALEAEIVRLRQAVLLDGVTELPGRRGFLTRLEDEVSRARTPGGFTVLLFDIDDFAAINAAYGHAAGDDVLRRLGRALVEHVGPGDCVARIGDDQFAVIALHAPSGASAAREWAQEVSPVPWASGGAVPARAVAVSYGYAVHSPSCSSTDALLNESRRSLLTMRAARGAGAAPATVAVESGEADAALEGTSDWGGMLEAPHQPRSHTFLRVVDSG